MKLHKKSWLNW